MVTATNNTSTPEALPSLVGQLQRVTQFFEQNPGAIEATMNVNLDHNNHRGSRAFLPSITFYSVDIMQRLFAGSRATVKHCGDHDFYYLDDTDIRFIAIDAADKLTRETEVVL